MTATSRQFRHWLTIFFIFVQDILFCTPYAREYFFSFMVIYLIFICWKIVFLIRAYSILVLTMINILFCLSISNNFLLLHSYALNNENVIQFCCVCLPFYMEDLLPNVSLENHKMLNCLDANSPRHTTPLIKAFLIILLYNFVKPTFKNRNDILAT